MRSITAFDLQYAHRFYGFHAKPSIFTVTLAH
ncbi:unknown [Prevotella sp. CAG:474]|nr:unknown [Prevotella sp. CAG:474]